MDSRRHATAPDTTRGAARPPGKAAEAVASLDTRQRDTAEYISEMILELRNLARVHQLYTVMVPLEYAYYEAFSAANRVEIPDGEIERIKELSRASQELEQLPPVG
jgi:hypothetical protein